MVLTPNPYPDGADKKSHKSIKKHYGESIMYYFALSEYKAYASNVEPTLRQC